MVVGVAVRMVFILVTISVGVTKAVVMGEAGGIVEDIGST